MAIWRKLTKTTLIRICTIAIVIAAAFIRPAFAQNKHLSVAILSVDPQQMAVYADLFDSFTEKHPDYTVKLDFFSDARYKVNFDKWMEQGTYDLLYWQGGRRLSSMVEADLVAPIEALLDKKKLEESYQRGSLQAASINNTLFSLPVGHYAWGVYYNKEVFDRLGLKEPGSWEEFLTLCQKIKSSGMHPLIQAKKDFWPLLGWLDYLAIEAGGLELRNALVSDKQVSIEQASAVSRLIKPLWENDYLYVREHNWEWSQTIPAVVRQQAAMTFMAQFAESVIAPGFSDKLGYFPFPMKQAKGQEVHIAPLDVWVVPNSSQNKRYVRTLLAFLSQPDVHHKLSIDLGFLPVSNGEPGTLSSPRLQQGLKQLQDAARHIQYFDRDAPEGYSVSLAKAMHQSIINRNMLPLEQALIADKTAEAERNVLSDANQLELSFVTYAKINLTYEISAHLRKAYQKMGVDFSVRRFSDLNRLTEQEISRIDGELARTAEAETLSPDFIRVDEPVWVVRGYLYCHQQLVCEKWNQGGLKGQLIGDAVTAERITLWYQMSKNTRKQYEYAHQMVSDFKDGKLSAILMLEGHARDYEAELADYHKQQLFEWPVYHYLHKRHSSRIKPLTKHLKGLNKANRN